MNPETFDTLFDPPTGGPARLSKKIDSVARGEQIEASALKVTSIALILSVASVAVLPSAIVNRAEFREAAALISSENPTRDRMRVEGDSYPMPSANPKVRMYWIFR